MLTYDNNATLHYDYDNKLDTLRSKWYNSDTTKSVQYFYDMQGRLALTKDMFANTSSQIIYDMAGREVEYIQRTDWNNAGGAEQVRLYNKYENKTNWIIRQDISVLGNKLSTAINYGNGELGQVIDFVYDVTGTLNGTNVFGLNYVYDNLGRMTSRQISGGITTTYGYLDGENNTTSTLIESVDNGGDEWSYEYDNIGNITKVFRNGELRQNYEYDHLNQLTRVNDKDTDATYCYQYDLGGNILQKSIYSYTTGEITTTANDIIIYQYGDTDWKDLLTGYDGQTFTYDNIGNPLTYRDGMTMTWQYGRQLASISRSGLSATYEYNGDGIRTSKTVNGIETTYYVDANGTILAENKGGTLIQYLFDESGTRIGLVINNSSYFYDFNVQGDVVALRDASGNKIATYIYDAWGKLIRVTDATGNEITSTSHVANMNSFRYRGYYYDAETGFYYVSSRYYDPEIGRFLNADTTEILSISPMLMTDKNLFAYCDNNPIVRVDVMGNVWETVFDVISLGASIAEVVANPQDPWAWAGVVGDTVDLIPFVSGVGEVTRAVKIANRAVDNIDTAKDIAKIATTGTPNKIGKVGESLAGINTKAKQRININGRVRIPDAMTNTTLTEVKNVKYISNTQQLKDFADYARLSNLNLILYVRPTTKISNTVLDAGWAIRKLW